jgi:2-methylisocitrate lyase-like PEP mutase family enzyme
MSDLASVPVINRFYEVIIGRADSAHVLGMEGATIRLKLAADAGTDVCFIEGVKSKELLESTVASLLDATI